ncbi:MAG: hypothetical protein ACEY3D_10040 [Rickettsia sp.]
MDTVVKPRYDIRLIQQSL